MKENHEFKLYLGLDTSAYTTSIALVDGDENLVFDRRINLPVKKGELGLRQSEAVFCHLQNLPLLLNGSSGEKQGSVGFIFPSGIFAVAAATRPRPVEKSYMPVFKVGEALGLFYAKAAGLNFLPSSHQEGHILAGFWSAGLKPKRPYLVTHLSGGTTEILSAVETAPGKLELQLVGRGDDLNAGQFVDRVGKGMGFGFPCGPQLEGAAGNGTDGAICLAVAVKDGQVSFSGPASQAERLLKEGASIPDLARAVEICIADSLAAALKNILKKGDSYDGILFVGGVSANLYIRKRLKELMSERKLYFAEPCFAADNAVGLAVQCARVFERKTFIN